MWSPKIALIDTAFKSSKRDDAIDGAIESVVDRIEFLGLFWEYRPEELGVPGKPKCNGRAGERIGKSMG